MLEKLKLLFLFGVASALVGVLAIVGVLFYYSQRVPDFNTLSDYDPKLITKIYARDGTLLAEYARERRIYVPIENIPKNVIDAYLAAEDTSFYEHGGFDLKGIVRAALVNILTDRRQGASTITQQVAKTFLLSSERTYERKIKELILAKRIEDAFTKNEILELYLNQIYLGRGSYGVASAALTYYNRRLDELSIGQRAMLAGLPKAPSAYNPKTHPRVARLRRDVIIRRMQAEGFITDAEAEKAIDTGLELNPRKIKNGKSAPAFSEHVRRELLDKYGSNGLYESGMQVQTTLDPALQKHAMKAIRKGLRDYDRRHGYRGASGRIALLASWSARIDEEFKKYSGVREFAIPAAVLEIDDESGLVKIGLPASRVGYIPLAAMKWARKHIAASSLGPKITKPSDVLRIGDIIFVANVNKVRGLKAFKGQGNKFYSLEQLPKAQAALVALDVHTGAVRAMVGGFEKSSEFNRAIQAKRQPGSAFKPLVYAYAMTEGYTPASIILDSPVVVRNTELDDAWKPQNYSTRVYGPSTLRRGLEKSRNLMTIRLAQDLGIRDIIRFSRAFGLSEDMPPNLSTALGSASASLLELTSAYSVFPNKGKLAQPYFIEQVKMPSGLSIPESNRNCNNCAGFDASATKLPMVDIHEEEILTPEISYIMTDLLRGVVTNGTGKRALAVGHPVGGKTGTTNDYIDAWFVGFSPLYAVGVWVGFDRPQPMGKSETGSRAALPIWTEFMKNSLRGYKQRDFVIPQGVTFVRIDADTGQIPTDSTKKTIMEVFVEGTEPEFRHKKVDNTNKSVAPRMPESSVDLDPQGIY